MIRILAILYFYTVYRPAHGSTTKTQGGLRPVTGTKTTRTQVHTLSEDERMEEIARMLGGKKITASTREHAREMLQSV